MDDETEELRADQYEQSGRNKLPGLATVSDLTECSESKALTEMNGVRHDMADVALKIKKLNGSKESKEKGLD